MPAMEESMTRSQLSIAFGMALSVFVIGTVKQVPAETGLVPCAPTMVRPKASKTLVVVPPDQDVKYGSCLFGSKIDFNQRDPNNTFATCTGCHPGNRTDGGTHPVLFKGPKGNFVGARQAPNLLN